MRIIFLTLSFLLTAQSIAESSITIFSQSPHPAVLSSLRRGLDALGFPYKVNPHLDDTDATVVILDGLDYLRTMIEFKKNKRIEHLLTGPNMMNRVCDHNRILGDPEIDIFFVPSPWVEIACIEDEPRLAGKIAVWFAGVDVNFWQPAAHDQKPNVLVYWKTDSESWCIAAEDIIRKYGYNPTRLRYGAYSTDHYKSVLHGCQFAVFLSRSESQGVALAEAWAMDVPTFVWNPQAMSAYGKVYNPVSACPYLTDAQGKDWQTLEQLDSLVSNFKNNHHSFTPRAWTLEHMTDQHSAQLLLTIIEELKAKKALAH
ncbi:hypothetical protein Noda2021_07400 [Candidatus Dependentiae bacterium Noda2021]|nr:hypothetical protein Noda2021_07400 [Candidatus Dependentiae bacterium Noda2021]